MRAGLARKGILALSLSGAFVYGFLCGRYRIFPYPQLRHLRAAYLQRRPEANTELAPPRWFPASDGRRPGVPAAAESNPALLVPYLQGYSRADTRRNVTVHRNGLAGRGLNLFASAHAPEAFLMDMDGQIVHRWRYEFDRVWPGRAVGPENRRHDRYWRRLHLFPNGDLLALFEGLGLIKVDKESRLLWAYEDGCHHDMSVAEDGAIHVLTREPLPRRDGEAGPSFEDFIVVLDRTGRPGRKISLTQCFRNSDYAAYLDRVPSRGDLFHTNRLQVLGGALVGRSPLFGEDRALISVRTLDAVAIVDLRREKVVWALSGVWRAQHDPTGLGSGRILVFDNVWDQAHPRSRVLEIDPLTQAVVWEYHGGAGNPFFSRIGGGSQRLPNGNTLIVESTAGRAFEVTPGHEVVWEFLSPFRAGPQDELVATLFDLRRLPESFPFAGSR
jgi:hypothetical protein